MQVLPMQLVLPMQVLPMQLVLPMQVLPMQVLPMQVVCISSDRDVDMGIALVRVHGSA